MVQVQVDSERRLDYEPVSKWATTGSGSTLSGASVLLHTWSVACESLDGLGVDGDKGDISLATLGLGQGRAALASTSERPQLAQSVTSSVVLVDCSSD